MDNKNNTGDYNTGNRNSGNCNSGNCNSGNCNSGHYNSGHYNSGHCNSGNRNSGHCNSGDYNSGYWNTGFFNTDEPNVRLFNKDTGLKRSDIDIPYIDLKITEEKDGKLIERSYKEAWKIYWSEASDEDKKRFLDLPNFDAQIFEEITGINVNQKDNCNGKIVEIDGKKYKLEEV